MKLVCKSFDMSAVMKVDEGGNLQPATIRRYHQSGKNSKHCIKRRIIKINLLIIKHLGVSQKSFDILIVHLKHMK